jgi:hypothetical protein
MERFRTIRKYAASRRFGKRGHDCLNPHDFHCAATPHDFHSAVHGEINRCFTCRSITHESRVATRPQVKPNSRFEYQDAKFQKNSAGKEMLAPSQVHYLSRGGTRGHCRYPEDQVPPRTTSRSRQKVRHANHMPLRVVNLSMNRTARGSSGAATCPVDPAPVAQHRVAPGPPRVLRTQLPLPSPGQLRGRHVSCGPSSRCPARGSSRAATCPTASAPAAQLGAAPGPPRVPWRPNGLRAVKVNRYPLSVAIMVTLRGVCASSGVPHDKQAPCACKMCGQGRLQGCNSAAPTRCPYTANRYNVG